MLKLKEELFSKISYVQISVLTKTTKERISSIDMSRRNNERRLSKANIIKKKYITKSNEYNHHLSQ